ncbi:hypothetical protein C2S53_001744 [Perilla frutescens var. hirtella]|uniref:RING-type domain-containing protein n=1 Tax=Perilla frutescens var. hirtella TaxID=608512 RepID=A0AAD4JEG2_PERFH|nr:hypothetical protein C2S53_001744 [Perilla frutescens var. hirtella]
MARMILLEKYTKERSTEEAGGGGCAICLDEYAIGQWRATIVHCNHRFHAPCIQSWLDLNFTCPLCRFNLV